MIAETVNKSLLKKTGELAPFIGQTPLMPIHLAGSNPDVRVFAKVEWQQFGNSVKARAAFNTIREAIVSGQLNGKRHLLDASSGNTGVAYAAIGAAIGIPVTLCIPENISTHKKRVLQALGARIIYTSRFETTDGAQDEAMTLSRKHPGKYFYADQYSNDNNWKAHYQTTAREIYEQTNGKITHFVCGLGTTGTFTGVSRKLKELNPAMQTISLQPDIALHGLEGWKHLATAKVPEIYDASLADKNLLISTETSFNIIRKAAMDSGLFLSPSSAANLSGAMMVADMVEKGVIVTVFPDHGSNYPETSKTLFQ